MSKVSTRPRTGATIPPQVTTMSAEVPAKALARSASPAPFDIEHLHDLIQQAETISSLLAHNFGGDGSFDDPTDAPGIEGMVQCVSRLLLEANEYAAGLQSGCLGRNPIVHASAIAAHLDALSRDDLFDGKRGFRIGDQFVSMCYWTIEKLAERATEVITASEVQS